MRVLHCCNTLLSTALALVAVLLVAGLSGWWWLSSALRPLPVGEQWLQEQAQSLAGLSSLRFASPVIYINNKTGQIELQLDDIEIITEQGKGKAETLKLALGLDSLINGRLSYEGLEIYKARIRLPDIGKPLKIPHILINPDAQGADGNKLVVDMSSLAADATLRGTVQRPQAGGVVMDLEVTNMPASLLHLFSPMMAGLDADITGEVTIALASDLSLDSSHGRLTFRDLAFAHPRWYPEEPLRLDQLTINGQWHPEDERFDVDRLQLDRGQTRIEGAGVIAGEGAHFDASLGQLPVDAIKRWWPQGIAQEPRQWVTRRLRDGVVTEAALDLAYDAPDEGTSAAEPVTFTLDLAVEGLTVRYLDHLPDARNARGDVTLTEDSLVIRVDEARTLKQATLTDAVLAIPSFSAASVPMTLSLPITAPAEDVARYMSQENMDVAAALELDPARIRGMLDGTITLDVPLDPEALREQGQLPVTTEDAMSMHIEANLSDMGQDGLLGRWDVAGFNGRIDITMETVELTGKGQVSGVPTAIDMTHQYRRTPTRSDYDVTLELPADKFPLFQIPIPPDMVEGTTRVEAAIHQEGEEERIAATFDFTQARLAIDPLNWRKPKGETGILTIEQRNTPTMQHITALDYRGSDERVSGSIELTRDGELRRADLSEIRTPTSRLGVLYDTTTTPQTIDVTGETLTLDLEGGEADTGQDIAFDAGNLFTKLHNHQLTVSLDKLRVNGEYFRDVAFSSRCGAQICSSMSLALHYNDDDRFTASIHQHDERRVLNAGASDLAPLVRALGISGDLRGGEMAFQGRFLDDKADQPLTGTLQIRDIVLKEAPILTKLLSVASLRGLSNTLQGKGIAFDKVKADIRFKKDMLTLETMAAKGDAMGIILNGTIRPFVARELDIKGTLIPSYTLNTLPGRIPLIGELLVGGEDEGVFATRFSVRGDIDDPQVVVNPLSMFTPGFLRGVFDAFPEVAPAETNSTQEPDGGGAAR